MSEAPCFIYLFNAFHLTSYILFVVTYLSSLGYKHKEGMDHICLLTVVSSGPGTVVLNKYLLDEQMRMQEIIAVHHKAQSKRPNITQLLI